MTVQEPFRVPRTVLPTNVQYFVPRVMEIRIEPWERFGIFNDTAAAICAAVADRRCFTFSTLAAVAVGITDDADPLGGSVVAIVVVAASVVVAANVVVAASVVVVAKVVVVATVVVVVGNALKNGTATAILLLS